jgi:hypothetical protein
MRIFECQEALKARGAPPDVIVDAAQPKTGKRGPCKKENSN